MVSNVRVSVFRNVKCGIVEGSCGRGYYRVIAKRNKVPIML